MFDPASSAALVDTAPDSSPSPAPDWGAVHELFEAQAAARPDAEAVCDEHGRCLSYGALNAQANQVARRLVAHGVDRGTRVGLYLDRSLELVVAILGVLKAGGAYVPLETTQPADRLAFMVRDAALPLVLTRAARQPACALLLRQAHDERPDLTDVEVLSVEALQTEAAGEAETNLGRPITGDDLAYVIYTSGSTGQPKGTEVPHRAIPGFAVDVDALRYDARQTLLHYSSISWDVLTLELWPALLTGGRTVVIAERLVRASDLRRAIETHGITTLWLTSSFFNAVVDEDLETFDGLQQLLTGGEALSPSHVRRVVERYPALHLVNGYGPSECTVFTTCQVITPAVIADGGAVPIGQPLGDRRVRVLDRERRLVPPGVVGELYVGGPAVPRGYGRRPALTAERLVPDPYGAAGARLYRTGDLVRWRCDGTLDFIGRVDDQVKVRGFRIELAEVELALRACPGVREAVVVATADPTAPGQCLVGYVVLAAGGGLRAIATDLGTRLPGYMVPTAWVALDAVPLTPNGKVDKRALPAPARGPLSTDEPAAPRDAVETTIAAIVSEVLGLAAVGLDDDFFALGGHSLSAGRALGRVRATLGVDLPLRAIFDAPTVAGLAQCVRDRRAAEAAVEPATLAAIDRTQPLPLSFAQERLWFLHQLAPTSAEYNVPAAYRLRGPLNVAALDAALHDVLRRHEALRTRFDATARGTNGVAHQLVIPDARIPLAVVDLSAMAEPPERLAELLRDEAARPFDLAVGPLVRWQLIRVADEEHVLSICQHHIASDGWSIGVFARELSAFYAAHAAGTPTLLPEPELQYADYSVWQRQWLHDEVVDRQLAYWKARLSGAPPLSTVPADRPRAKLRRGRGARVSVAIDSHLAAALAAIGGQHGTTLFMTLLAGFHGLISRYSGQTDVVVGTPVAGRRRPELEAMIGFFVNSLALRADLSSDPSFLDLLQQVRESVLDAQTHQDLPFERLVEALAPERDLSRTPLFQVMFAFHPAPLDVPRLHGIDASEEPVETVSSKFDLTLNLHADGDALAGWIDYDTDLFDERTILRLVDSYAVLLRGAAADPRSRMSALPLVDAVERRRLLTAGNHTACPLPETPVHTWIEARCANEPEATGVSCGDCSITCAELDRRANQLAHRLIALGVRPGDGVALGLERSVDMVTALLAVFKAGAFYLPLDPALPAERRRFILEDSRVRLLLVDADDSSTPVCDGVRVVSLRAERDAIDGEPTARPEVSAALERTAYVLYTSGSTGRPKGVAVGHLALANFLRSMAREPGLRADDTLVAVTTLSFDIAGLELYLPLAVGARLVVARREEASDPRLLKQLIERHRATVMQATPATWLMLLDAGWPEPGPATALCGGEALPRQLANRLLDRAGSLWNMYGPTETTIWSAVHRVERGDGPVSIGHPIDNTQTYVLDAIFEPVPMGVTGELLIGGDGVAQGYLGRPALTAERFVPDPFGASGGRLYCTGDRVRQRDGAIEFVERRDHQVKIRGFRVELGEVEAALARLREVRQAAVVARGDTGDQHLVAYVVWKESESSTDALADAARDRLADALPPYMVPRLFVALDALPLGPGGKVDRLALPAPDPVHRDSGRPYLAPRTPLEELVAGIWSEVLGLARPDVRDDFFALGGHSLKATQVLARLRARTGAEVPLAAFFAGPTIERLSRALQDAAPSAQPAVVAGESTPDAPLSLHQRRLWFLDQLEPGSSVYNLPMVLRLSGDLDVPALERSLTEIVRRHQVLHTTFGSREGEPMQQIGEPYAVALSVEDLRAVPDAGRDGAAATLAADEAARPFDLARGPLLRARLLRLAGVEWQLLITIHHIVSDAWSLQLLTRELGALYESFSTGRTSPLPSLPVQYADFARWQQRQRDDAALDRQLAYWKAQLDGAPTLLDLPTDRPRPSSRSFQGNLLHFSLPADVVAALRGSGRQHGTTLYMTLLAAFAALLHRYAGTRDLLIGSPASSRRHVELESLIGFFVNTLVMRVRFDRDLTVAGLLSAVRAACVDAQAHQDVPFERIVEELQPARSLSHAPLVQAMFVFDSAEAITTEWGGVRSERAPVEIATTKHDLTLYVSERGDAIEAAFNYSTDLFDAATIERLVDHFQVLIAALAHDPECRVADLPMLTAAGRRSLLDWGRGGIPLESSCCVHEIFERHAAQMPLAPAVVFEHTSIGYRNLNARAAAVAHRLRTIGVGPDVRVALCAERGLDMIVGLLGILKAGGAYVPLDPDLPIDRLSYMLADSQARVLLFTRGAEELAQRLGAQTGRDGQPLPLVRLHPREALLGAEQDTRVKPSNLAYVIYTSGSTGRPKGVAVEHRHLTTYALNVSARLELPAQPQFATVSTIAADLGNTAIFSALCRGGSVHVVSQPALSDPDAMGAIFTARGVDGLKIVPSHLSTLLGGVQPARVIPRARLVLGGEASPWSLVDRVRELAPGCAIFNHYGPTETTVGVLTHRVGTDGERRSRTLPIGRPLPGVRVYVVDAELHLMPAGVPGELLIGGATVARGYLGRPELTASSFMPDPFAEDEGQRVYRTGDRVRFLPDGSIEFLGRVDDQVKIRGYRVEPGEVTALLRADAHVHDAAVVAAVSESAPDELELVAYVVARHGAPADLNAQLRARIAGVLPSHMVPAAFVALDALPVTANGKLDRRALPRPVRRGPDAAAQPAETPVQQRCARIWEEVLGVPAVGLGDDFFSLGGHSLKAVRVLFRVREAFGGAPALRTLFETPTLEAFAAAVCRATASAARSSDPVSAEPSAGLAAGRIQRVSRRGRS